MRIPIAVIAIAVSAAPAFAQDRAADEEAIRNRVSALSTAISEQDAAAYAALFTEDGTWLIAALRVQPAAASN